MSTGNRYAGINVLILASAGYPSPWFGTYRQVQELGGQVRKGEHSSLITFWKELHLRDDEASAAAGETRYHAVPMLRVFHVFNAAQCDGLPDKYGARTADVETDADAEAVVAAYVATGTAPAICHDVHGQAYYRPSEDTVHIPPANEHRSAAEFYSTLWHELAHSTGHASRLDRWHDGDAFTGHARGVEELTAEMGAAFLSAETGTATDASDANSAAYVSSWLQAIKADKRMVIRAAAAGQRASDLIMGPYRAAELVAGFGDGDPFAGFAA